MFTFITKCTEWPISIQPSYLLWPCEQFYFLLILAASRHTLAYVVIQDSSEKICPNWPRVYEFKEKCEPKNLQTLIKETFSGQSHPIMNPYFVPERERMRSSCKKILKSWFGGQLWVESCWFDWDIHNKVYFRCSLKVNIISCIGLFRRRLPAKGCRWLWYWWYNPKS